MYCRMNWFNKLRDYCRLNSKTVIGVAINLISFKPYSSRNTKVNLKMFNRYCRSGNIREVSIFARKKNSRIQESRENYFYNSATREK